MVIVYTQPSCVQCEQTKKLLTKEGIPYTAVDVSGDEEIVRQLRQRGVRGMPYVVTPVDGEWSGFRPDRLRGITR